MLERCTDELDMANQLQSQANEQAVAAQRRVEARREQLVREALDDGRFDGTHCIVCEDVIPEERIAQTHMHCTPCAQVIETKNKRMGK